MPLTCLNGKQGKKENKKETNVHRRKMKKEGSSINNYKKNEMQTLAEHSTTFKLPFHRLD